MTIILDGYQRRHFNHMHDGIGLRPEHGECDQACAQRDRGNADQEPMSGLRTCCSNVAGDRKPPRSRTGVIERPMVMPALPTSATPKIEGSSPIVRSQGTTTARES